jgi:hypothetical protein
MTHTLMFFRRNPEPIFDEALARFAAPGRYIHDLIYGRVDFEPDTKTILPHGITLPAEIAQETRGADTPPELHLHLM